MSECDNFTQDELCGSGDGCTLDCGDGKDLIVGLCLEDQDCVDAEETAAAIAVFIFLCFFCICGIVSFYLCLEKLTSTNKNQPVVAYNLAVYPKELPK